MYAVDDLDLIVEHHLASAVNDGYPPRSLDAWLRKTRESILEQEDLRPGFIAAAARGLRARAQGQKITGWRETRGTHGIDYVRDPNGTAKPPWI